MATVKIVLDTKKNNQRKDGSFPIKMKVEHKGKHLPLNLKRYALLEHWKNGKLNSKYKGYKKENLDLQNYLTLAENMLSDYEVEIRTWSCKQLRDFIADTIDKSKIEKREKNQNKTNTTFTTPKGVKTIKLFEYGEELIKHCEGLKLYGRAKSYKQALSAFIKFTNYDKEITFAQITSKVLEEWKTNMRNKPMKDTSYNAYLRGLRAIINHGIKDHKLPKDGNYGFQYFTVGTPKETTKRALNIDVVKQLFTVQLEKETSIWHTQQQAIFMFNTNGINFRDLAYLRMNQIIGDFERVVYNRAKTHRDFDIVIAGKSKDILRYYAGDKKVNSNELIFPILPENIIGQGRKEVTLYESRRKVFNQNLKKIASICEIDKNVTSYVLRHSFATGLKHSGVDENIISEQMGHDSVDTTRTYLANFETEKKDSVTKTIAI
ncbi:site-specific integrase [Aquimarina sp. 2201CG1-2-11]|uniref:tyrosine-type recombinase/integrase n=1 Tax=Aquimarina discodermiae TaxID=3231043 RepID=UPI00346273F8